MKQYKLDRFESYANGSSDSDNQSERPYRDESWIRKQYVDNALSTYEIADLCDSSHTTIRKWLDKFGIERRDMYEACTTDSETRHHDEDWLRKQYIELEKTTYEIADICDCSKTTILRWLDRHGIETRDQSEAQLAGSRRHYQDEDWLRKQYIELEQSTSEIAEKCETYTSVISRWLSRYGIETRDREVSTYLAGAGFGPDSPLRDEDWMREQYTELEKSSYDIADQIGCAHITVLGWLEEHGIDRRARVVSGPNHPQWNGGEYSYGTGWTETKRERVRKRDGCKCVRCGMAQDEHKRKYEQKLHVHHLTKARDIEDPEERNAMGNLVALCRECHWMYEKLADVGIRPQIDLE